MDVIDELCDLLQVHAHRDKVACLACYVLKLWGATKQSTPLMTAASRLAQTRAVMRLFDDAASLKTLINYGLGKQEGWWAIAGVSNNLSTVVYQQLEKLNFLIDTGILPVSKDTAARVKNCYYAAFSLVYLTGFFRSLRPLHLSSQVLKRPDKPKCAEARFTQAALTTTKYLIDIVHAVNWLPRGVLWGQRLTTQQASAFASVGAALGIALHYRSKQLV